MGVDVSVVEEAANHDPNPKVRLMASSLLPGSWAL